MSMDDVLGELERFAGLLDDGDLSLGEFEMLKARLLTDLLTDDDPIRKEDQTTSAGQSRGQAETDSGVTIGEPPSGKRGRGVSGLLEPEDFEDWQVLHLLAITYPEIRHDGSQLVLSVDLDDYERPHAVRTVPAEAAHIEAVAIAKGYEVDEDIYRIVWDLLCLDSVEVATSTVAYLYFVCQTSREWGEYDAWVWWMWNADRIALDRGLKDAQVEDCRLKAEGLYAKALENDLQFGTNSLEGNGSVVLGPWTTEGPVSETDEFAAVLSVVHPSASRKASAVLGFNIEEPGTKKSLGVLCFLGGVLLQVGRRPSGMICGVGLDGPEASWQPLELASVQQLAEWFPSSVFDVLEAGAPSTTHQQVLTVVNRYLRDDVIAVCSLMLAVSCLGKGLERRHVDRLLGALDVTKQEKVRIADLQCSYELLLKKHRRRALYGKLAVGLLAGMAAEANRMGDRSRGNYGTGSRAGSGGHSGGFDVATASNGQWAGVVADRSGDDAQDAFNYSYSSGPGNRIGDAVSFAVASHAWGSSDNQHQDQESGPTCCQPGCGQPGVASTAAGWLCGGHTLVILDPKDEVHRAGRGPWR